MSGTRVPTIAAVAAAVVAGTAAPAQDAGVRSGTTAWGAPNIAGEFVRADAPAVCDADVRQIVLPPVYAGVTSIEQAREAIVIRNRHAGHERTIVLAGPPGAAPHRYLGEARGRWDGQTLVITSTRLHPSVLAALTRRAATDAADVRLIERLTPTASGQLEYEFAVDDPWYYAGGQPTAFVLAPAAGAAADHAAGETACPAPAGS